MHKSHILLLLAGDFSRGKNWNLIAFRKIHLSPFWISDCCCALLAERRDQTKPLVTWLSKFIGQLLDLVLAF